MPCKCCNQNVIELSDLESDLAEAIEMHMMNGNILLAGIAQKNLEIVSAIRRGLHVES